MFLLPGEANSAVIKAGPRSKIIFKAKEGLSKINDLNARHKQLNRPANETSEEAPGTPVLPMPCRAGLMPCRFSKKNKPVTGEQQLRAQ